MKTLHIHIGTAKTGTTSIQRFCMENEKVLKAKGYCFPIFPYRYPDVSRLRAHFLLGIIQDKNGKRLKKQEEKNFEDGIEMVRRCFQTYDHVILSDESIWRGMDSEKKDFWEIMAKEAEAGNFKLHVIVYLRRQDKYFFSLWNQKIKHYKYTNTFEEFADIANMLRMDYYYKLEKIAGVIGRENISVRQFEKEKFDGGTLYSDFLGTLGLPFTEEYQITQEMQNTGLYGNNYEIKRVLNEIPQMDNLDMRAFFVPVLRACSDISRKQYASEIYSKEEIREFLKKYQEGNRKVAEEYLHDPGGRLFDDTIPDIPKWEKDNPYMMDDVIRFVGLTVMQLHKENMELKKEAEKLEKIIYYLKHPFRAMYRLIKKSIGKS